MIDQNRWQMQRYFNPHSREGSDGVLGRLSGIGADFNPHSREGSDITHTEDLEVSMQISIHTPAKGVTQGKQRSVASLRDFNPHSREGSDYQSCYLMLCYTNFNPHSREGSDQIIGSKNPVKKDFNPHSREGSDPNAVDII